MTLPTVAGPSRTYRWPSSTRIARPLGWNGSPVSLVPFTWTPCFISAMPGSLPLPVGSVYYVATSRNSGLRSGRRIVTVWLLWSGVDQIDALAAEEGVDRSAMIRILLAEAMAARRCGGVR